MTQEMRLPVDFCKKLTKTDYRLQARLSSRGCAMLISFAVENFRSFDARQEVSFVCSALKDFSDGVIEVDFAHPIRLLPALVVYGANAAGKSNLITSLEAMISTVLNSHSRGRPEGRIPTREAFRLDPAALDRPTVFDINFFLEGEKYNYGFSITDKAVVAEWLYTFPQAVPRKLFERAGKAFSFGRSLKGKNKVIEGLTRENSLFLSAAAQNSHDELLKVYNYFSSIKIETMNHSFSFQAAARLENELEDKESLEFGDSMIAFLKELNSGIVGYRIKERNLSEDEKDIARKVGALFKDLVDSSDSEVDLQFNKSLERILELEHSGKDGLRIFFPIRDESAGTLRLLASLPKIFKALASGSMVLIDELNLSVHTQAVEQILRLFCSRETNPKGAQLLATVHDTNLLASQVLRRDQVWFVSKNSTGMSEVYPLTDFRTRASDDLERGYLEGRFGATPL